MKKKWIANYEALKAYVIEHKHLTDKHKETNRNKLSWWKCYMKKKKAGTLIDEQIRLLDVVVGMRSSVHIREDIEGF